MREVIYRDEETTVYAAVQRDDNGRLVRWKVDLVSNGWRGGSWSVEEAKQLANALLNAADAVEREKRSPLEKLAETAE